VTNSKLPANVQLHYNIWQQTSSIRPALRLLEVCWTFAGSCKRSITHFSHGYPSAIRGVVGHSLTKLGKAGGIRLQFFDRQLRISDTEDMDA